MWKIQVKPKQFYLDDTMPKITTLVVIPTQHIPNVGIKYFVKCCKNIENSGWVDPNEILQTKEYELKGDD